MSKEAFYFQHDYEPTGDPKISAMLGRYGAEGYGIFWRIVEILHADPLHKIPLKPYMFDAIATQLHTNADQVQAFIRDCVDRYCLFVETDGFLFSERVDRNIARRSDISAKRAEAASHRWGKARNDANAMQLHTSAMQTDAKKRKGKESKEEYASAEAEVIDYLNGKTGKRFKVGTAASKGIIARIKEGATVEECKRVIDVKVQDKYFMDNPQYLNPETLFRPSNFERYRNETGSAVMSLASMTDEEFWRMYNPYRTALNCPSLNGAQPSRKDAERYLTDYLNRKKIGV